MGRRTLAPMLGLALVAAAALAAPAAPQVHPDRDEVHREGEYGLWVREGEDGLEVRWLTRATGAGFLELRAGDSLLHRRETPASFLHEATVPMPDEDDEGRLTLRYGSATDAGDRHETPLRLPLDPPRRSAELPAVDTLYVVGDVHGEFDRLTRVLRAADLVDGEGRWTGGGAHVVFLGDVFDRGPDVTRTLWFLYGLEAEAAEAGGGAHLVLGNHEIMVLTRDLRYVSPKENSLAELRGVSYTRLFDLETSVLGRWLASRPAAMRIGPVLLAHGGIGPAYADYGVEALNDSLATYMGEDVFRYWSDSTVRIEAPVDSAALDRRIEFFFEEESVFWYRGYLATAVPDPYPAGQAADDGTGARDGATSGGEPATASAADSLADVLDRVLREHDARVHVVAHTPLPHVEERFGGRLIGVDLRRPAAEMLLMVRDGDGGDYRRHRIDETGVPRPLTAGGAPTP